MGSRTRAFGITIRGPGGGFLTDMSSNLPAHYAIDAVCAACRGAIKRGADRYRIGDRDYHAHCFDISLFGAFPTSLLQSD